MENKFGKGMVATTIFLMFLVGAAGFVNGETIIIDDGDSDWVNSGTSSTGTWNDGTYTGSYNNDDKYKTKYDGTSSYMWYFDPSATGSYNVYAWWPAANDRGTDTPYYIHHNGGAYTLPSTSFVIVSATNDAVNNVATVKVDQTDSNTTENPGQVGSGWVYLGKYSFNAGDWTPYIEMTDGATGGTYVVADAIRIETAGGGGCTSDTQCPVCQKCNSSGSCVNQLNTEDAKNECTSGACGTGFCNGTGACNYNTSTTVCRAANGLCDVEEKCTGTNETCPADGYKPVNTVCRAGNGVCNPAETCNGSSASCPADQYAPLATDCGTCASCNGAGNCTYNSSQTNDCTATSCPDSCDLVPDSIHFTWDWANDVPNTCSAINTCTANACNYAHVCNKSQCGATCDSVTPCNNTECDNLDGCIGTTYRDYNDIPNTCQGNCTCTNNTCTSYTDYPNDGRCGCNIDNDCNSLDDDYCAGTVRKHDEGTCNITLHTCYKVTTAIQDCNDGKACNGTETCQDLGTTTQCNPGTPVNCASHNIPGIAICTNIPDGILWTWDFRLAFTSVCQEPGGTCPDGNNAINHTCNKSCGAQCESNSDCTGAGEQCNATCGCQATPCTTDDNCSFFNNAYCEGTVRKNDQGVCQSNYCVKVTTTIENCNDGKACNGTETCQDLGSTTQCNPGTPVNCASHNIPGIATCLNDPDNVLWTWDFRLAFTSVCQEPGGTCPDGNNAISHTCNTTCGAQCVSDSNCSAGQFCNSTCGCEEGTPVCGNGVKQSGEQCDPMVGDSAWCPQSMTGCVGPKLGARDDKGACVAGCVCQNDSFTNFVCNKNQCGAACDSNDDCDDGVNTTIDQCNMVTCGCQNIPTGANVTAKTTNVTVKNTPPFIEWKWELPDEDGFTNGTQVYPNPNGNKTVIKCAIACDLNGIADIADVEASVFYPNGVLKEHEYLHVAASGTICWQTIPTDDVEFVYKYEHGICEVYEGNFTMEFNETPGVYKVVVEVNDTSGQKGQMENNFTYLPIVGIVNDISLIQFPQVNPGEPSIVSGDIVMGPPNPTVMNIGNVLVDIKASGTVLNCVSAGCGTSTLPIPTIGFNATEYSLAMDGTTIYGSTGNPAPTLPIPPGGTNIENFMVQVPLATPSGNYQGTLVLTGIAHT